MWDRFGLCNRKKLEVLWFLGVQNQSSDYFLQIGQRISTDLQACLDHSLIEIVWDYITIKVPGKHPANGKYAMKNVWTNENSAEYYQSLTVNMPSRIKAVIKAKRRDTKQLIYTENNRN